VTGLVQGQRCDCSGLLTYCNIVTLRAGVGPGSNRPWGALINDPNLGDYILYNDLNLNGVRGGTVGLRSTCTS
jgi:hypothetical protein